MKTLALSVALMATVSSAAHANFVFDPDGELAQVAARQAAVAKSAVASEAEAERAVAEESSAPSTAVVAVVETNTAALATRAAAAADGSEECATGALREIDPTGAALPRVPGGRRGALLSVAVRVVAPASWKVSGEVPRVRAFWTGEQSWVAAMRDVAASSGKCIVLDWTSSTVFVGDAALRRVARAATITSPRDAQPLPPRLPPESRGEVPAPAPIAVPVVVDTPDVPVAAVNLASGVVDVPATVANHLVVVGEPEVAAPLESDVVVAALPPEDGATASGDGGEEVAAADVGGLTEAAAAEPEDLPTVDLTASATTAFAGSESMYVLAPGQTLREVFAAWCAESGWTLHWNAAFDYPIAAGHAYPAGTSFEDAVRETLRVFWNAPKPLVGALHANRVLVVSGRAR